jgi:hypothetical protein
VRFGLQLSFVYEGKLQLSDAVNPLDRQLSSVYAGKLYPRERKRLIGGQGVAAVPGPRRTTHLPGPPGSDTAIIVLQARDACAVPDLQVVGTSATMASAGEQEEVANVASRLFGPQVKSYWSGSPRWTERHAMRQGEGVAELVGMEHEGDVHVGAGGIRLLIDTAMRMSRCSRSRDGGSPGPRVRS